MASVTVNLDELTWYRRSQCDKHHRCDRVLQAHGAAKMRRQVTCKRTRVSVTFRIHASTHTHRFVARHRTDDGGEQPDHADGHDEARPAVPVLGGRHEGEQDLPENGEEVHDVVEA